MKPAEITRALRRLTEAKIATTCGDADGEFTVDMPATTGAHIGITASDHGGYAGSVLSRLLGERIHVTGYIPLRGDIRRGSRIRVTLRLHAAARGEAAAALAEAGYGDAGVTDVLDRAEKFPNSYQYTSDRRRAACMAMPYGRWDVADKQAEQRIAAAGRRGGIA